MYFPDRNYADIIDETERRFPHLSEPMKSLRFFISKNRRSLKEKDAKELIIHAKNEYESKSSI
jgi:hypothetical protein